MFKGLFSQLDSKFFFVGFCFQRNDHVVYIFSSSLFPSLSTSTMIITPFWEKGMLAKF